MKHLLTTLLTALLLVTGLALTTSGAFALDGTAFDEDTNGDAFCRIVEKDRNDIEIAVETTTIGVPTTPAYLSTRGSIPTNETALFKLTLHDVVLVAWDAEGNAARCYLLVRARPVGVAGIAGPGGPGIVPPPGTPPTCTVNCGPGEPPTPPTTPKEKGNNGVGNGEDGQPPGDPPVNDGSGTGPGTPGNNGGNRP